MPPRKKPVAEAATADAGNASAMDESMADSPAVGSNADESVLPQAEASFVTNQQLEAAGGSDGIDAYELARTQVTKVAKSAIPDNIQLRREVIMGLMKSSTVFINYLAAAALEKTHEQGHKTITANTVVSAFKEAGFPESYVKELREAVAEKQEADAEKLAQRKEERKAKAKAAGTDGEAVGDAGEETEQGDDGAGAAAGEAQGEGEQGAADEEDDDEEEEEEEGRGEGEEPEELREEPDEDDVPENGLDTEHV